MIERLPEAFNLSSAVPTGLILDLIDSFPTLKRGTSEHCAYGAGPRVGN
jgi:hypothetical protein